MLFVIGIGLHNIVLDPWKQQIDTTEAAKHDDHALKHQLVIWQDLSERGARSAADGSWAPRTSTAPHLLSLRLVTG